MSADFQLYGGEQQGQPKSLSEGWLHWSNCPGRHIAPGYINGHIHNRKHVSGTVQKWLVSKVKVVGIQLSA
ncbi:hypothetical protein [Dyadobacter sp. CY343]|uniref:hypothetical protein n=1 Tax=Dyadobacter sp. CY343 TaxID=2907299 RepID=UPI001F3EB62F|nr:hypothetical protein [Dyadobacter sp. CY343]MCE7059370.1 hypothetical protein [Dyadobacter sp. CY343]